MASCAKLELVAPVGTAKSTVPEVINLPSERITIGRSSKLVDVILDLTPTNTLSRRHAAVTFRKGRQRADEYIIRDLASTNGVFVNSIKILEHALDHGDIVQFGGAADIPVGTRFGGSGTHIRYRFVHEVAVPAPNSNKRRYSSEQPFEYSEAQRPKVKPGRPRSPTSTAIGWEVPCSPSSRSGRSPPKLRRTGTAEAVETLCAIAGSSRREIPKKDVVDDTDISRRVDSGFQNDNGHGKVQKGRKRRGGADTSSTGGARDAIKSVAEAEKAPAVVLEVLRDAMCGLCSELLLDAVVLPCSHSFCKLCWADHAEAKGTICPVCMRKFHSSERNPRRCSNLDLLITSMVHKMAGLEEQKRWRIRQEDAQKRLAVKAKTPLSSPLSPGASKASNSLKAPSSPGAAGFSRETPAQSRAVRFTSNVANLERRSSLGGAPSRNNPVSGKSGGNAEEGGNGEVAKCDGCNESGHRFRECPHRSDSALEQSEEEESEDSEEDDNEGSGEADGSDDA